MAINKHMVTVILVISPLATLALLYAVSSIVDPATAGPLGILLVFFLIYLETVSILFVMLRFGLGAVTLVAKSIRKQTRPLSPLTTRRSYYIASSVAFIPVTLLAMHSLSRVGIVDIILVTLLASIATIYVIRRDSPR